MKRSSRRRGFTIWELLVVIILLGTVSVLMPRVFGSSMRIVRTAPAARDEIVRFEAMLTALHKDVWNARALHGDASNLQIDGDFPCRWTIDHDEIVRSENEIARRWKLTDLQNIAFEISKAGIVLHVDSADISFASEVIRLNNPEMQKMKRAFATTAALLMISIVAAAVATLTLLLSADVKRTDRATVTAQLDELLHAGAVDALASLRKYDSRDAWEVSAPTDLEATIHVRVLTSADQSHRCVRIEAAMRGNRAGQTINCVRVGADWRVESAQLDK